MNDTTKFDYVVDRFIEEGMRLISRNDFSSIVFIERVYKEGKITAHDTMYISHFVDSINELGSKASVKLICHENRIFDEYEITIKLPYMS